MLLLQYSHDSYGLGHVRRSLEIAKRLSHDLPQASFCLLTGSMQAHAYPLPERLDYIKLPAISKDSEGRYCSCVLPRSVEITLDLRKRIILETVRTLEPDLILVDKSAAGVKGELLPGLSYIKSELPGTKIVLGMRDIEDDAAKVRADWTREGIYPLLRDVYDAIALYGSRSLYDPVKEYGLSSEVEEKLFSCGYVHRSQPLIPREKLRQQLQMRTGRLVVVTVGGGADGSALIEAYLAMLRSKLNRSRPEFDSLVITGPLMKTGTAFSEDLHSRELALTTLRFTPDLFSYLNAADLVVSMGGYNSVVEILSLNQRAIVVPRVKPREEQLIRTERLAARNLVRMIHPKKLTPDQLFRQISESLESERPPRPQQAGVDMNGAANASRAIRRFLSTDSRQAYA